MAVQPQFLEFVLEQLAALPALRASRMFGGVGLYSDGLFFGLIDDDTVFFKTDDSNIGPYRDRNMPKFMPFPDRPEAVLGYHQVPADVIEDAETLTQWAKAAVAVALAARAAKTRPRHPRNEKAAAAKATRKKSAGKKSAKKPRARTHARKASAGKGRIRK